MSGICEGRVAIVTGAGRGIGRGHALELARQGAKVVVNDIGGAVDGSGTDVGPAQQVVDEIVAMGGDAVANTDSVSDWEGAQRMINQAIETYGTLDVVVNNAGILRDRMVFNMTEEEWDAVIAVHLKGTFALMRWAASYWREKAKAGEPVDARIINTSSTSGIFANPGQGNYGAAKSGIASLTIIAAKEMGKYGVTANAIAPGARTRMTENLGGAMSKPAEGDWDERSPDNIAPLVTWLASSESKDVTGQVFIVGGGRVNVAVNWQRGPGVDKGARWDPAELGSVVPGLVEEAGTQLPPPRQR
ncbi:SDR family oxidoreductase [Actinomarinicola tropica]|uniref:SDR family oxidoreductase n=1 Tax=Actinomarinicola tropica TaxID=2789776 RepID=A0A5Q2RHA1_9ACTN|nr:SDR family oxidoreductase [Actinomarinicola tropica]QGG96218.1 SDR family oxidoreductase [Actinomarinicola tropica]